jgi:hypothetical protein
VSLEHPDQPVTGGALAAGAVADRGILPEGADLVDERHPAPLRHLERGKRVQNRGMDVQLVRLPFRDEPIEPLRERPDLPPFAQRRRSGRRLRRPVKTDAVDRFRVGPGHAVPRAGQAGDLPSPRLLRLDDRARPERIAAVERKAVVEHVQDTHAQPLPRQT